VSAASADPSRIGRNGGSPNLFADDAVASTVVYSNSTYETIDTFGGTVNYVYSCLPTEKVVTPGTPGTPATPAVFGPEDFDRCVVRVAGTGVVPGQYCKDPLNLLPNVLITPEVPGTPGTPETTDYLVRQNLSYGYPFGGVGEVTASVTGTDSGVELNGGQFSFNNQNLRVTAVVCNSPGRIGGTWTPQNSYSGLNCNNTFFSTARQVSGNNFGLFIPSNSLPN
jgi:hypothetical protein